MVFLEKRTIFFECFMDIPDFKTCKVIKIEFNKQIIDRYDSKLDFRALTAVQQRHLQRVCSANSAVSKAKGVIDCKNKTNTED